MRTRRLVWTSRWETSHIGTGIAKSGSTRFTSGSASPTSSMMMPMPLLHSSHSLREIAQALLTSRSGGKKVKYAVSRSTRASLETIARLIGSGVLQPVVDTRYPMAEVAEAHRLVEGRHERGSVILQIGSQSPA